MGRSLVSFYPKNIGYKKLIVLQETLVTVANGALAVFGGRTYGVKLF